MKKVLVTGGAGYIGSHTVVELCNSGFSPVIVDNLSNSHPEIIDQIEKITGSKTDFYRINLRDIDALSRVFDDHPDISDIIHFAAFKAVGESSLHPLDYYENNIVSLINLLKILQGRDVNFVFSSSCTVYGEPDKLPVTESTELKPTVSPYGNTKKIAEDILRDTARADSGLRVISCRYFNPVGAHESGLIGELPIGSPQNLIPIVTRNAIGKREKFTVFGDDYDTPDGTAIRDYVHVVDLAKAHICALRYLENKKSEDNFDVYNVGTGNGYSVLDIIKSFEKNTGVKLNYDIGPRRAGDIAKIYADPSKAAQDWGWRAVLGVDEMMETAWKWEKYIQSHPIGS